MELDCYLTYANGEIDDDGGKRDPSLTLDLLTAKSEERSLAPVGLF
jgi:hypothetical protein